MSRPSGPGALPSDPFESLNALPGHVRLRRKFIGWRSAVLLVLGGGFLVAAWWVRLR